MLSYRARLSSLKALLCTASILPVFALHALGQEWQPPEPSRDGKDWVQLKSGEWVRGSIDLFRDLEMEFDSDKLDDLRIDWDDIIAFRAPRDMTFVFTHERIVFGPATMRDGVISITTKEGIREFHRDELLSIIEGVPRERNFWSIESKLGITLRTGNTEQTDLMASLGIKREAARTRLSLDYKGDFSEVDNEQTANSHTGGLRLDLFISRRFFITPVSYEYYSDKFQNIEFRSTIGAGVGYYIFRSSDIDWSIGIGGGHRTTAFLSVEAGEDKRDGSGTVIPSSELEMDITDDIELKAAYRSMIGIPDAKSSTHHVSGSISIDIYKDFFDLDFSVSWDRVADPKAYEDGTLPKKDDLKMFFGFGIDI